MKSLLSKFNWKNFLQRTLLFFLVFLIIRFLVDWLEKDISLSRIFQQSMVRYILFAMILGILDSETWLQANGKETDKPLEFKNRRAAFLHYIGVAFFISLLCGIILSIIVFIRWAINAISGSSKTSVFPDWDKYLLVVAAIGICFAFYDAIRNYRRLKKDKQTTE